MNKKIYFVLFFVAIFLISLVSMFVGYSLFNKSQNNNSAIKYTQQQPQQEQPVNNITQHKITSSTKMVYEYFYKKDSITERVEDVPPYFLVGLTRQDLEQNFPDWVVKSFSSDEVLMQKTIDAESTQHYIVKDYDGIVAVFYKTPIEGNDIKEITDIMTNTLPKEEQDKLKQGIEIKGKEELYRLLEGYTS